MIIRLTDELILIFNDAFLVLAQIYLPFYQLKMFFTKKLRSANAKIYFWENTRTMFVKVKTKNCPFWLQKYSHYNVMTFKFNPVDWRSLRLILTRNIPFLSFLCSSLFDHQAIFSNSYFKKKHFNMHFEQKRVTNKKDTFKQASTNFVFQSNYNSNTYFWWRLLKPLHQTIKSVTFYQFTWQKLISLTKFFLLQKN